MIWWVALPGRARQERAALADLQERASWLTDVVWRVDDGLKLVADFNVTIGEQTVPCSLRYPDYFPDAPASVIPREMVRLSTHQYGPGGELCLEHRADNWSSEITGAMMVESAFRLLSGEQDDAAPPLPSAHRTTVGQSVRATHFRFALNPEAMLATAGLPRGRPVEAAITEINHGETWVASLSRLGPEDDVVFEKRAVTEGGRSNYSAVAYRLPAREKLPKEFTADGLIAYLEGRGLTEWTDRARKEKFGYFLLVSDAAVKLWIYLAFTAPGAFEYRTVVVPGSKSRLPDDLADLSGKSAAIVGCGSVGSKVAVSLARTGVSRFLLIDPDLFYPDNVVRNDLDLRAVAVNKTAALKQRILEVNPQATVRVRSILLGGQESAESTASAMSQLAENDVVVDATADPDVFNLCAAVAKAERRPMAWGQVFGGGVGGLVAMARPEVDPPPLVARNQILSWYANRGVPWDFGSRSAYEIEREAEPPLVAADAEVSVIASHLTRLALECLSPEGGSTFPYPAYVVGLKASWIFSAPFDTHPISYTPQGNWGVDVEDNAADQVALLLEELFPKDGDAG